MFYLWVILVKRNLMGSCNDSKKLISTESVNINDEPMVQDPPNWFYLAGGQGVGKVVGSKSITMPCWSFFCPFRTYTMAPS